MLLFKNILFLGVCFLCFSQTTGTLAEKELILIVEVVKELLNSEVPVKELELPSLYPFRLRKIDLNLGDGDGLVNGTFTNVKIKGLTDFTINYIIRKRKDLNLYADVTINKIEAKFKFDGCINTGESEPFCLNRNIFLKFGGEVLVDIFFALSDAKKLKVDRIDMGLILEPFNGRIGNVNIKKIKRHNLAKFLPAFIQETSGVKEALSSILKNILNKFSMEYDDIFGNESDEQK